MIGRTLSCDVIRLPEHSFPACVEAAQSWIGSNSPDTPAEDVVTWMESEILDFDGSDWMSGFGDVKFSARRAIAKVGSDGRCDLIAIVSGFASVTSTLSRHVARHVVRHDRWNQVDIPAISFNVPEFYHYVARRDSHYISGEAPMIPLFVEGTYYDGSVMTVTSQPGSTLAHFGDISPFALGVSIRGIEIKVDASFAMSIKPSGGTVSDVCSAISTLCDASARFRSTEDELALSHREAAA